MAPDQLAVSPYQTYGQVIRPQFQQQAFYQPVLSPPRPQSVWDTYRAMFAQPAQPQSPMESAVQGLRHNGEGMAIAALLALAYRHFGTLDVAGKYPVDGILGALLLAWSVKEAGKPDGYASDLRALSQSCTSVLTFRKLSGVESNKPKAALPASPAVPAPSSEDPVIQAARAVGF